MSGTGTGFVRYAPSAGAGKVLSSNRFVVLAAVPLFLILAVAVYLTVQFAVNERTAQNWVRHTYQVIQELNFVIRDAQDAETGQRGYLLTGQQDFLAPYNSGRSRIAADLARFRELTRDNPSEQVRAGRLEGLVRDRFSAFDNSLVQDGKPDPAQLTAALNKGKQRMDALRHEVGAGVAEEQRLLAERDRERRQTENLEIAFALGAALLTLGVLLFAAVLLVRNNISLTVAERARANEPAILQATLETVRDGVAYFTSEGLLCAFNLTFFRLLDLPERLAVQQETTLAALEALEADRPVRVLSPPADSDNPLEARHVHYGERELDVYKAPVATGGFLIGVQDVSARMRAEGIARQSQKMEAIGHLTGGIAHDFNNLLQIISANLDLAVAGEGVKTDPKLRERLQNAVAAVGRGSRLTGQLLAFARRQALEPRSIDLGRVIRDMSDMLRRTLGERVAVETVIGGGLWNTLADPSQVENTVLNLAINARDAMPDGGKLTLEVANAHLDDRYAAQHVEVAPGQYVMLAVSDTGTGMTPEVLGRVFEPFFTTKPEGKGTGLGLAQAYGFVKQTGGHIKIYSEVGHGTTIKLYLPRTRREQDMPDANGPQAVVGGSERILVVEDDEGVRAAVVDMLADLGYAVHRAEDAESALAMLAAGEKFDLLFTDVVMPGNLPTREFTRRAQEMIPDLLVLYTSGYTQNAIVHNGKLDDDAFLLSKPYRKDELARKLRSVFAGTARGPLRPPETIADRQGPPRSGKVLVVEDVALIRMTTVDMLEQIGFTAAEAGDGAEALAVLQKDDEITILLTDLGLPGMNGRQLVEEALRLRPDLKVIVASGYSTEEQEGGRQAGVAYLTKPFDVAQLRRVLES
jgi:signal transduction histidine kinase/CheY-like chemotaxis protein